MAATTTGIVSNDLNHDDQYHTRDPDSIQNTSASPLALSAHLIVQKTPSSAGVLLGEELLYTIVIRNEGPDDAENLLLTDTISGYLLTPQYSLDEGMTWNNWSGSVSLGTLASGGSVTVLIRAVVSSTAAEEITNTATAASDTPNPNPADATSAVTVRAGSFADLSIQEEAFPVPALPGQTLTFTLTISNAGPSEAREVYIRDLLPQELSNVVFSIDGGATWKPWFDVYSLGTFAPGEVRTVLIRGLLSPFARGTLTNIVTVDSTTIDPNPFTNTFSITLPVALTADLSVFMDVCPNPVAPCGPITYTLLVTNAGPAAAQEVILTDAVPEQVINAQYSPDSGQTWLPWTGAAALGNLDRGSRACILIRGMVNGCAGSVIYNTASVTAQTSDPNPGDNQCTAAARIQPPCSRGMCCR